MPSLAPVCRRLAAGERAAAGRDRAACTLLGVLALATALLPARRARSTRSACADARPLRPDFAQALTTPPRQAMLVMKAPGARSH
jgi:hypothetical protein